MKKVIHHAKVYLGQEQRRPGQTPRGLFAGAVLIEDGHIRAIGSNQDMMDAAGPRALKIDAQGHTLVPGFADCHLHLYQIGRRARVLDGTGLSSIGELIERGRELISQLQPSPETVILGAGLNPEAFTGDKRYPNRDDLDKISRAYPIIISRVCGHRVFCNSKALEIAGLANSAPDVAGGETGRDERGRLTGIFAENAAALVRRIIPPPSQEDLRWGIEHAMKDAASYGLTSAASFDTSGGDFDQVTGVYREIYETGPHLRVTLQCGIGRNAENLEEYFRRDLRTGKCILDPYLKVGPLKLFADGSLGAQTAWLRAPYSDKPESSGLPVVDSGVITDWVTRAHNHGFQVLVHAIGDAAVEMVVASYEQVISRGENPLRHGVLHCQISDIPLLERIKKSDILTLVQPIFLCHDLYITESRVGKERASTSYAWNSMEKFGIHTAYGTDCPVESLDPIQGIACAVTRKNAEENFPPEGFYPQEQVDVCTAVDNYTLGTAYANFDEKRAGRIKPGYLADLALLDQDIFTVPPDEISQTKALFTMIGGETVFQR